MIGLRSLRRRAAREDGRGEDKGFTLVELLVSMSIFTLILSLAIALLVATQRQTASTQLRLDDIDQARTSIDSLSRIVRTAVEPAQLELGCTSCDGPASTSTALTSATASSIQLFANGGATTGPTLVTFSATYDAANLQGTLTRTTQKPDLNSAPDFSYTACTVGSAGCLITKLPMVRGLQWPLPRPLFTYYDQDGDELVLPTSGALTPQQLIAVDSIAINLTVKTTNKFKNGPTTIYSLVELPNSGSGVLPTPGP